MYNTKTCVVLMAQSCSDIVWYCLTDSDLNTWIKGEYMSVWVNRWMDGWTMSPWVGRMVGLFNSNIILQIKTTAYSSYTGHIFLSPRKRTSYCFTESVPTLPTVIPAGPREAVRRQMLASGPWQGLLAHNFLLPSGSPSAALWPQPILPFHLISLLLLPSLLQCHAFLFHQSTVY